MAADQVRERLLRRVAAPPEVAQFQVNVPESWRPHLEALDRAISAIDSATVPGQSVAIAGEAGPARGTMYISVDSATAKAVSAYQTQGNQHRDILWAQALTVGTHTVKITNAGTAGHSRVDVDAILLSRPR